MKRNRAFDVLKLALTIVIIVHHSHFMDGALVRGYIPVEFFFMTSGFFLAQSFYSHPQMSTVGYYRRRAGQLFPEFWISLLILITVSLLFGKFKPYPTWYAPILELLMMHNLGFPGAAGINYPTWYLSVMLYGGVIIYLLMRRLPRKAFSVTAILSTVAVYVVLMMRSTQIEQWDIVGYVFYLPFWRGTADMLLGVLLYQLPPPSKWVGRILELGSFLGIVLLLFIPGPYDFIAAALSLMLVYGIKSPSSIFDTIGQFKPIVWLNQYQYGLFLNHAAAIAIMREIPAVIRLTWKIQVVTVLSLTIVLAVLGSAIAKILPLRVETK